MFWIQDTPPPVALDDPYTVVGREHFVPERRIDMIEISTKYIVDDNVPRGFVVVSHLQCVQGRVDDGPEQNLPHCEDIRHTFKIFVPEIKIHTSPVQRVSPTLGPPVLTKNQGISKIVLKVQELRLNAASCWTWSTEHFVFKNDELARWPLVTQHEFIAL